MKKKQDHWKAKAKDLAFGNLGNGIDLDEINYASEKD